MRIKIDMPPGLVSDDTTYNATGRWAGLSNVRFWRGQAQPIGGWEKLMSPTVTGVCRTVFGWTDNQSETNIAFGTHSALQVYQGGGLYTITPAGFTAGNIDGTGGRGYGTGAYGVGTFGTPSNVEFFPLTWSLSNWYQNLIANPRGGKIYVWQNNLASPATVVANAPVNVTYALVSPTRQLFALGCNEEVSGTFNPLCIRHSSAGNYTVWNTLPSTTSREYILPSGGRIVAGSVVGQYLLIWTAASLYLGTFVGDLNAPWRFDKVGDDCGLIGPNAFAIVGQRAFWIGPNLQFYTYTLGGAPVVVNCPIRNDFADNLAASQGDKIVGSTISFFDEIRFDYPDKRDGKECSRYIAAHVPTLLNSPENAWYRGNMVRTAFSDAPPASNTYPIGVDGDGNAFWHERGNSANGGQISWHAETADIYLDENLVTHVRCLWPDFKDQTGAITATLEARFYPQGEATTVSAGNLTAGQSKSDFRISGRLIRVRYENASSGATFARFGSMTFDAVPTSQR